MTMGEGNTIVAARRFTFLLYAQHTEGLQSPHKAVEFFTITPVVAFMLVFLLLDCSLVARLLLFATTVEVISFRKWRQKKPKE